MLTEYPKIPHLGTRDAAGIFCDPVTIQEKIDGSQFSFGRHHDQLFMRSHHNDMDPYQVSEGNTMWGLAADFVRNAYALGNLNNGWTYRAEYLRKPKHNKIAYSRFPRGGVAIFDIQGADGEYLPPIEVVRWCEVSKWEFAPYYEIGVTINPIAGWEKDYLNRESFLGGSLVEGIVIKNYKRRIFAKVVSPAFRETAHLTAPRSTLMGLIEATFKTPMRWEKAIQHLKERGNLEGGPQDIGPLIAEIRQDIFAECEHEIKAMLFNHHKREIDKVLISGFAEWYKERLMKEAT